MLACQAQFCLVGMSFRVLGVVLNELVIDIVEAKP